MKYNAKFAVIRTPTQSYSLANSPDFMCELFETAIYVASKDLWSELVKYKKGLIPLSDKLLISLTKYWLRFCVRPTPYGFFAGSSVLEISPAETNIVLENTEIHERKLRLDMAYLFDICNYLLTIPGVIEELTLYTNNSIYETDYSFRYVEYRNINKQKKYSIVELEKSAELNLIYDYAKNGIKLHQLVDSICDSQSESKDAHEFILKLLHEQFLKTELEPNITGDDPLKTLLKKLENKKNLTSIYNSLSVIQRELETYTTGITNLVELENKIYSLFPDIEKPGSLFQVDFFPKLFRNTINEEIVAEIANSFEELLPLSQSFENNELETFKTKFIDRFQDEERDLALTIDSDLGIGFGIATDINTSTSNYISDFTSLAKRRDSEIKIREIVLFKYIDYIKNKRDKIEIEESDITMLSHISDTKKPDSLYLFGSIFKKTGNPISVSNFTFFLSTWSAPNSSSLFGRFAYADDSLLEKINNSIKLETSNSDVIFAEIVHIPQSRIANITLRPFLTDFEIPYVGESGIDKSKQIKLSDLNVSVVNNEIILIHKQLRKRVIPRLTTAHNFLGGNLPVYKFLCQLQFQGFNHSQFWNWGPLESLKTLPRVTYKNIILKKALWRIEKSDLLNKKITLKEFFNENNIPSKINYIEGDNKILIDISQDISEKILMDFLTKKGNILLEEFIEEENNLIISDKNGRSYTNEIVIPLHSITSNQKSSPKILSSENKSPDRVKLIGINCLYFKIYSGSKTLEIILTTILNDFLDSHKNQITKFFFIRYRDPETHLRLRIFVENVNTYNLIFTELTSVLNDLLTRNIISNYIIDNYFREIERYLPELIDDTESLFYYDSMYIINLLASHEEVLDERERIILGILSMYNYLEDFDMTLFEKIEFSELLAKNFFIEFGGTPELQKKLNMKYRGFQNELHEIFSNGFQNLSDKHQLYFDLTNIRSQKNKDIVIQIRNKCKKYEEQKVKELLSSYIHMSINRLFISNARKYELLIYHFIAKYLKSLNSIILQDNK